MSSKSRAARYQADRTNQKMYFCRLAYLAAESAPNQQQHQAHCEAAIFHLHGAYLAFLQELNAFYGLAQAEPTPSSLEAALAERTQVSPEVVRLQQLLAHGVLADIVHAYARCQYAPKSDQQSVSQDRQNNSTDLIVTVVSLSKGWLPDETVIAEWREQLLLLIEQLRAGMIEY